MTGPGTMGPSAMSFLDHWEEFRRRFVVCLAAFGLAAIVAYPFLDRIFLWIVRPVGHVVFTSPGDAFWARITLAMIAGFFLSLPVILWQAWAFAATGLKEEERRAVRIFAPVSLGLFLLGAVFAYGVAVPVGLRFLLGFATAWMVPMITIKNYLSFVATTMVAFGVIFELPLVLVFLTKIGIATPAFLTQKRRHAIVLIMIVSALITPPDLVALLIMAAPLVVLYEIGIWVSRWAEKLKREV